MALDYNPALEPCPICGKKASVMHIVVDGFSFGWDAGCPSAKREDGVHGFGWDDEIPPNEWPRVDYRLSKQDAIDSWNAWVGKWKENHNGNHQHNSEEK